jgi:hypothetical protein
VNVVPGTRFLLFHFPTEAFLCPLPRSLSLGAMGTTPNVSPAEHPVEIDEGGKDAKRLFCYCTKYGTECGDARRICERICDVGPVGQVQRLIRIMA